MFSLRVASSGAWLAAVLDDFDRFLLDHASAERKASAVAVSLITHYPDREALVDAMMDLAREELEHFYQVYLRIAARGLVLGGDEKDAYVGALRNAIRRGPDEYFLDRLLVSGVIEARGCERFGLIARAIEEPELAAFYRAIADSEDRHRNVYLELARTYFPADAVESRLDTLLVREAEILASLEIRAALH